MYCTKYSGYSPLEWDSEFSVGSWELDNQHRKLTAFYNDALGNCSGDRMAEREYFDGIIDEFINFLSKHFAAEEQILSGVDYPQYDEHKLDHKKLLEKIRYVKKEAQNHKWEMNLFILAITLKDWLMYHFETYDTSAKEHFRDKAAAEMNAENSFAFQR